MRCMGTASEPRWSALGLPAPPLHAHPMDPTAELCCCCCSAGVGDGLAGSAGPDERRLRGAAGAL